MGLLTTLVENEALGALWIVFSIDELDELLTWPNIYHSIGFYFGFTSV